VVLADFLRYSVISSMMYNNNIHKMRDSLDTQSALICLGVGVYLLIFEGFFKIGYKIFSWRRAFWMWRLMDEDTYGFMGKMMGIIVILFSVFAFMESVLN